MNLSKKGLNFLIVGAQKPMSRQHNSVEILGHTGCKASNKHFYFLKLPAHGTLSTELYPDTYHKFTLPGQHSELFPLVLTI